MTTSQFEEGSLEQEISQAIFEQLTRKMQEGAFDIYNVFGILVRGEVNLTFRVEDVRNLAEYIRQSQYKGNYIFKTLEYLPTAFDFNLQ